VLAPVYNDAEHLAQCIESVLSQTYSNWEYLIVNNCSTDESGDIARIDLAIVSLGAPAYVFWRYHAPAIEAESVIN
jgi:glycosyltransferase involved in cell wall biosynthesis